MSAEQSNIMSLKVVGALIPLIIGENIVFVCSITNILLNQRWTTEKGLYIEQASADVTQLQRDGHSQIHPTIWKLGWLKLTKMPAKPKFVEMPAQMYAGLLNSIGLKRIGGVVRNRHLTNIWRARQLNANDRLTAAIMDTYSFEVQLKQ